MNEAPIPPQVTKTGNTLSVWLGSDLTFPNADKFEEFVCYWSLYIFFKEMHIQFLLTFIKNGFRIMESLMGEIQFLFVSLTPYSSFSTILLVTALAMVPRKPSQ